MTSSPILRLLSWGPALSAMSAIFWVSSLPGDAIHLPGFRFSDKVFHFLAYALLGILIGLRHDLRHRLEGRAALAPGPASAGAPWPGGADRLGALAGILYGLSDEIHQSFVPLRESAMSDFAADALGVLAGLWVVRRLARMAAAIAA